VSRRPVGTLLLEADSPRAKAGRSALIRWSDVVLCWTRSGFP